ncbi:MAG TPA: hypothetical protein VKX17_05015 [Planctomycetota bacterium]|nr:hypothetical protein [Planctomycetota bacterium]
MKLKSLILLFLAATLTLASAGEAAPKTKNLFQRRYVLVFANLMRDADCEKVLSIARRAAAAGYNGIVLGARAGEYVDLFKHAPKESYTSAFAELRKQMDLLHLALIPYAINPNEVGYAAPELSEAIPCRDTPFLVHDGIAEAVPDPAQLLANPGFEALHGNSPDAWSHDKPGVITFMDSEVKHGGNASLRIQDPGAGDPKNGHGRLWQTVSVRPFRAFEFSIWLKTRDLTDADKVQFHFQGVDGGQPLVYANREAGFGARVKATQDWTQYTVHFNSASNTKLQLFLGIWSKRASGTLWFDDADLHEVGLFHTVRRESLPLTVVSADGAQTYDEGHDYAVGDGRLTIPKGSRIADGARLKVSWYQRAEMIGPPFANASHPKYFEVERGIAEKLDTLFVHPPAFMMTFDEWRVANWDPAGGNVTAGEYVAKTVRQSTALLKQINPRYELYVWSDMFDPNENALEKYFMANGPLTGAWKGLSNDTVVMTWTGGAKALRFFSELGLKQMIGGYYSSLDNVKKWLDAVDEVEGGGANGIDGFMYTTWDDNFTDIEKVAELIKARGRWQDGAAFGEKGK